MTRPFLPTCLAALLLTLPAVTAQVAVPDVPVQWWENRDVLTTRNLHAAAALDADTLIVAGERGVAYVTDDAGRHWSIARTGLGGTVTSFSFVSPRVGWALDDEGGISRTLDGGATWTEQRPSGWFGFHNRVVALGDGRAFVAAQAAILWPSLGVTFDGGATWEFDLAPIDDQEAALHDVAFAPDGETGVAVGRTWNGRGYVVATADGGRSWELVTSTLPSGLRAAEWVGDSHVLAVGDAGAAYTSTDGGHSWTRRATGTLEVLTDLVLDASGTGFATGRVGAVVRTVDGGVTWTPERPPTVGRLHDAALAPDGSLWVVADEGGVLVRRPTVGANDVLALAPDPRLARPPILIVGNDGFRGPASGVTAGSGTADDPFVIEGWRITPIAGDGIALVNTTAHVVVRDNAVAGGIGEWAALRLANARNVVVQENELDENHAGVVASACADVTLHGNLVKGHRAGGASFTGCERVRASGNVVLGNAAHGLAFTGGDAVDVTGNRFVGNPATAVLAESRVGLPLGTVLLADNSFVDNREGARVVGARDLALDGNTLAFSETAGATVRGAGALHVAANAFTANEKIGLDVEDAPGALVSANAFAGQPTHVRVKATDGVYEANSFRGGHHSFRVEDGGTGNAFRGNDLVGVYAGGVFLPGAHRNAFTGNTVDDAHYFFTTFETTGNRFEWNVFRNSTWGLQSDGGSVGTVIANNTFEDAWEGPSVGNGARDVIVENNVVRRTLRGIWSAGEGTVIRGNDVDTADWSCITVSNGAGALVEANRVRGCGTTGVLVRDHDGARVTGNDVTESAVGIEAYSNNRALHGARVDANRVHANDVGVRVNHGRFAVHDAIVDGNDVAGNGVGLAVVLNYGPHAPVDARGNWWGAADGPSGLGPGSGDAVTAEGDATVTFDPWLTEDPFP